MNIKIITLNNININEAYWLHTNGITIALNKENGLAEVNELQYDFILKLRKWWKWKVNNALQSNKGIKFIDIK